MLEDASQFSSNVFDVSEPGNQPTVTVSVVEARRVNELTEIEFIQPYLSLQHGSAIHETGFGKAGATSGQFHWEELVQFHLTETEPVYLMLFDHDEYGEDRCIASVSFDYNFFEKTTADVWLHLRPPRESISTDLGPEDLATPMSPGLLGTSGDAGPLLHLVLEYQDIDSQAQLSLQITQHKNVAESSHHYTVYRAVVTRSDGHSWNVPLRYSQVRQLRQEVIQVLPALQAHPFPAKTYFDWLGVVCPGWSRFDSDRIERRKRTMEAFLNSVLERRSELESQRLTDLLFPTNDTS